MRQLSFIALLGTLTILMGGCGGGETETATSPTPAATTPATEATPQQSPTQPFSSPMVDPKQTPKPTPGATKPQPTPTIIVTAPSELTPPTDPNQRTAQVQKEIDRANRDPFGITALELNPQQPNQNNNNNRTPTQKPNRAIPTVEGVPEKQPPVVIIPGNIPTSQRLPGRVPVDSISRTNTAPARRNIPTSQRLPGRLPVANTEAPKRNIPTFQGLPLARVPVSSTPSTNTEAPKRNIPTLEGLPLARVPVASISRTNTAPARRNIATSQRLPGRVPVASIPANRRVAAAPNSGANPTVVAPPAPPEIPTLPPPPDPILAKAVEVSGVVVVGAEPQAIIKAPNEANSRYVRTGQRLANGQVLVKRIEFNEGSEPIVILEQNGVEVAKVVGERPPTAPTAPAAPAQSGAQAVTSVPVTGKRQPNV